jgi:hypothetical protein
MNTKYTVTRSIFFYIGMGSGYANATFSKAISLFVGINSVIAGILDTKQNYDLALFPHIFPQQQFWRFGTCHFCI